MHRHRSFRLDGAQRWPASSRSSNTARRRFDEVQKLSDEFRAERQAAGIDVHPIRVTTSVEPGRPEPVHDDRRVRVLRRRDEELRAARRRRSSPPRCMELCDGPATFSNLNVIEAYEPLTCPELPPDPAIRGQSPTRTGASTDAPGSSVRPQWVHQEDRPTTPREATMPGFIQTVTYTTSRIDEVRKLGQQLHEKRKASGDPGMIQISVCADRDTPNRYTTVVEFASYDEAMANSNHPDIAEFSQRMAKLVDGPPTFVQPRRAGAAPAVGLRTLRAACTGRRRRGHSPRRRRRGASPAGSCAGRSAETSTPSSRAAAATSAATGPPAGRSSTTMLVSRRRDTPAVTSARPARPVPRPGRGPRPGARCCGPGRTARPRRARRPDACRRRAACATSGRR